MTTVEDKLTTEEWLAIRKEAGLRIDPATGMQGVRHAGARTEC